MDILRLRIVFQRCWIYRYESTCDCIKSRGRASGPDLAEVGEGRQIVRCSHIAHRARSPRLVILHCSSTSIFKSAPPPPCPFLPATTSSFYHLFSCGNLPLQKPSPTPLLSFHLLLRPSHESIRRFTVPIVLGLDHPLLDRVRSFCVWQVA